ncbi:MAG TPA: hypothetical protein VF444_11180 [Pseudonocardiaceae bacterium]
MTSVTAVARASESVRRGTGLARVPFGLWLAVGFFALVCVVAAFPGLFAGSPDAINPAVALRGPSAGHLFGTDQLGRDVFARVVFGARSSLLVGLGSTLAAGVVGSTWGLLSAVGGGERTRR